MTKNSWSSDSNQASSEGYGVVPASWGLVARGNDNPLRRVGARSLCLTATSRGSFLYTALV